MSQFTRNPRIILASKSPRRRSLLEMAGIGVTVVPSDFVEGAPDFRDPPQYARTQAEGKANAVASHYPDDWVIGADTIVVIDDQILGKPKSRDQARSMLDKLSDRTHQVYTGWCIHHRNGGHHYSEAAKTDVAFKRLSGAEIEWYIHTDEPFDKAGSYAIQGLGTFLVKRINGSYTNVVGLPVCEVAEQLLKLNVIGLELGTFAHN